MDGLKKNLPTLVSTNEKPPPANTYSLQR